MLERFDLDFSYAFGFSVLLTRVVPSNVIELLADVGRNESRVLSDQ